MVAQIHLEIDSHILAKVRSVLEEYCTRHFEEGTGLEYRMGSGSPALAYVHAQEWQTVGFDSLVEAWQHVLEQLVLVGSLEEVWATLLCFLEIGILVVVFDFGCGLELLMALDIP